MVLVSLVLILLCRVIQAFFSKRSSNAVGGIRTMVAYLSYQNTISAVAGLVLILWAGKGFAVDMRTVLISCLFGSMIFFATFCNICAMKSGTVSLCSVFGTAGILVPILAGAVLFGTAVAPMQVLGIALFLVSAWILIGSSRKVYTNFSFKTVLLLLGMLLANGGSMLAQQLFAAYVPDGDVAVFSILSFGLIALLGWTARALMGPVPEEEQDRSEPRKLALCGPALAMAVFFINQLSTGLAGKIAPAILFTVSCGGSTIISTLVAAWVYREKLTRRSAFGVLLGIVAIVLIKVFE